MPIFQLHEHPAFDQRLFLSHLPPVISEIRMNTMATQEKAL